MWLRFAVAVALSHTSASLQPGIVFALPRQRRSPPLIVSSERGVFMCDGRKRTGLCFRDPLWSGRAPDTGTNRRDGATRRPVTSAFQDKQRLNHSWSRLQTPKLLIQTVWVFFFFFVMGYLANAKAASEMKGCSKVQFEEKGKTNNLY